jgi:hypothetical protein
LIELLRRTEDEYESYAWKRKKNSIEEDGHWAWKTRNSNHLTSAARYFLTEMVKANADPEAEARQRERAKQELRLIRRG